MNACEIECVLRQLVESIKIWYYTSITYRLASNNPFLCTVASIDEHGAQQINDTHSKYQNRIPFYFRVMKSFNQLNTWTDRFKLILIIQITAEFI